MTCSARECEEDATEVLVMLYIDVAWRADLCAQHKRQAQQALEGP